MLTDFRNSFVDRLSGKFAAESYLNIPQHVNKSLDYLVVIYAQKITMLKKSFWQTAV